MTDVFISYKSEEYAEASRVRSFLEQNNISCWMAPESIPGGSNYAAELSSAIKNCSLFVLILSQKAQQSQWVAKEINLAVSENKKILPYQIEKCSLTDEFILYLTNIQMYRAYENKDYASQKLVDNIFQLLDRPPQKRIFSGEFHPEETDDSPAAVPDIRSTDAESEQEPLPKNISWGFLLLSSLLNIAVITLLSFLFGDKLLSAVNLSAGNLAFFWGFIVVGGAASVFLNIILREYMFAADHSRSVHIGICLGSLAASVAGSLLYIPLMYIIPVIILLLVIRVLISAFFGE